MADDGAHGDVGSIEALCLTGRIDLGFGGGDAGAVVDDGGLDGDVVTESHERRGGGDRSDGGCAGVDGDMSGRGAAVVPSRVDGIGVVSVGAVGKAGEIMGEGIIAVIVGGFDLIQAEGTGVELGFIEETAEGGPARMVLVGERGVLGVGDVAEGAGDAMVEGSVDVEGEVGASSDVGEVMPGVVRRLFVACEAGDLAGGRLGVESGAGGGDAEEVAFVGGLRLVAEDDGDVTVGVLMAFLPDHEGEVTGAEVEAGVLTDIDVLSDAVEVQGFAVFAGGDVRLADAVVVSSEVVVGGVVSDAGGVVAVHGPVAFKVAVPVDETCSDVGYPGW